MTPLKEKLETVNSFGWLVWLTLIVGSLSFFALRPDLFEPERIRQYFSDHLVGGLVLYFIITTLRGLTLIPLSPFLLAAILVLPPWPLFLVNQLTVFISTGILYYVTRYMRFDTFFFTHYSRQTGKLVAMLHKRELPVITLWGFIPVVPTDMIICVCSVLRISVWKTLIGVSVGEGVICAVYIFGGAFSLNVLLNYLQI